MSCDFADALVKLGISSGGYIQVAKGTRKIEGPAYTVEMVTADDSREPLHKNGHYLDSVPQGSIVVIKVPDNTPNAVFGGLMATRAQVKGAVGTVTNGFHRDGEEMLDYAMYSKGTSVLGAKGFTKVYSVGQALEFKLSNGMVTKVNNGDWIVADSNGVVCVPIELLDQVKDLSQKIVEVDTNCKQAIQGGMSIQEAFSKFR